MVCPAVSRRGSEERECAAASKEGEKREQEWLERPFMLPGSPPRAKWHQSFLLGDIYKFENSNGQNNCRTK